MRVWGEGRVCRGLVAYRVELWHNQNLTEKKMGAMFPLYSMLLLSILLVFYLLTFIPLISAAVSAPSAHRLETK